jgi:Tfp pilus assembly PilM family ATPase
MGVAGLELGSKRATYVRVRRSGTDVYLEAAKLVDASAGGAEDLGGVAAALGPAAAKTAVRLSLAGRDAILRYLHMARVPPWRLRLLMEFEVAEVAEKAGEPLSSGFRALALPDDIVGADGDVVLVGLAKENALLDRIGALEAVKLRPRGVLPSSIALFDAYAGLGYVDEAETTILVDAGIEGTEIAICRSGSLVFARGFQSQSAEMSAKAAQSLAAAIGGAVQFARSQLKLKALPVDRILVSGAHARASDLLGALRSALKVEVETFDPLERLDVSPLGEAERAAIEKRGPELAIALGLALADQHPRCVEIDLTPRPILARRDFLTRTVFLYAAGALLAAALVVAGATAAIAGSKARERRADLGKTLAALEARRDSVNGQAAANKRSIEVLDALSRRTRPGAAALRLMARLRAVTPRRITVHELSLEPASAAAAPAPAQASPAEIAFRLRAKVDNAGGDAIQLIGKFVSSLQEDAGVASARIAGTPVSEPGAVLDFSLIVTMRADVRTEEQP